MRTNVKSSKVKEKRRERTEEWEPQDLGGKWGAMGERTGKVLGLKKQNSYTHTKDPLRTKTINLLICSYSLVWFVSSFKMNI